MNARILAPQAPATAPLQSWHQPHPAFTSGKDARSSENALLVLMYGSLDKAARFDWLNAGRTLIDKTYLRILWATQGLEPTGISFDELASRLDGFIRTELQPRWDSLAELDHDGRHELAQLLLEQLQVQVFQSPGQLESATSVLFFLCPQLPVFLCRDAANTEAEAVIDYPGWHQSCRQRLALLLPLSCSSAPSARYGTAQEQQLITRLLAQSDWWPRRLLAEQHPPHTP
ncbi:hypothetical protein [Marinobacterium rhizophilum]|uniref:Uncharacterized protein n=1 Tax=Marinobacterium rhizophilum TaxID=420402 RepID=A0ABY5HJC6_9GAMM|nr:hypothetical protein [Marinobacterium rhizophilum]UTW11372.1 hypothetical protein KDW95_19245 [Marinobacterium rhizophilum]